MKSVLRWASNKPERTEVKFTKRHIVTGYLDRHLLPVTLFMEIFLGPFRFSVQISFGAHSASSPVGTGGASPGGKAAGA